MDLLQKVKYVEKNENNIFSGHGFLEVQKSLKVYYWNSKNELLEQEGCG